MSDLELIEVLMSDLGLTLNRAGLLMGISRHNLIKLIKDNNISIDTSRSIFRKEFIGDRPEVLANKLGISIELFDRVMGIKLNGNIIDYDELYYLRVDRNFSIEEIGSLYSMDYRAIRKLCILYGIHNTTCNSKKASYEKYINSIKNNVAKDYLDGHNVLDIREKYKIQSSCLNSVLNEFGIVKRQDSFKQRSEFIKKLYLEGKSINGISEDSGMTISRLSSLLSHSGISKLTINRRHVDLDIDKAIALLKQGKTVKEVSYEMGLTYETLFNKLRLTGIIPLNIRKFKMPEYIYLVFLGKDNEFISKHFGLSGDQLEIILARNKEKIEMYYDIAFKSAHYHDAIMYSNTQTCMRIKAKKALIKLMAEIEE